MKIGILTLPFNNNYGGYLQAYALMTVVRSLGHDVKLIYRRHNKPNGITYATTYAVKSIVRSLISFRFYSPVYDPEKVFRSMGKNCMQFLDNRIVPKTEPIYTTNDLRINIVEQEYEVVIVGSDQVWRPEYVPNVTDFFLGFVPENVRRIAYAASFGTENPIYSDSEREECGRLFTRFDAVGVRESAAMNIIERLGWHNSKSLQLVLDPTMLLSQEHYRMLAASISVAAGNMMFCYILDPTDAMWQAIDTIANNKKMVVNTVFSRYTRKHSCQPIPSVEQWIAGFRDAQFIVTDSFHGTVFSIIFHKPFAVISNEGRGRSRFESLLFPLGLGERLISAISDLSVLVDRPIDFQVVDRKLAQKISASISFLRSAIED